MKKRNVTGSLLKGLRAAFHYWGTHAASHRAMRHVYERKWQGEEIGASFSTQILINPQGHLYQVINRNFYGDNLLSEESYLATYAWQCNGHLIGLGSYRILVFNPALRQLILEDWPDHGGQTTETFEQI